MDLSALTNFQPVENMSTQKAMKPINFSGFIFMAIWLKKSRFKDYKIGFLVKTKDFSEK